MADDSLIKVAGVSKKFCRSLKKSLWYGMQDLGREIRGQWHGGNGELRPGEFWAVKDVSFELKRGECLGLIGRNGAGKTTLLRMLNGLIKPDAGRIVMRGRVGALIALGAGFNPILTGRENIYVNASVLGLSKRKTDDKFDEIVDFAEIGDSIDAPVQSYSSGMRLRLGFATAITLTPDILLLDEVLAVGDVRFRMKCYAKIDAVREQSAVILVSHSIEHIGRICTSTFVIANGREIYLGATPRGLEVYLNSLSDAADDRAEGVAEHLEPGLVNSASLVSSLSAIASSASFQIGFNLNVHTAFKGHIRFTFVDLRNNLVAGTAESRLEHPDGVLLVEGNNQLVLRLNSVPLRSGRYDVRVALFNANRGRLIYVSARRCELQVKAAYFGEAPLLLPLSVAIRSDPPKKAARCINLSVT